MSALQGTAWIVKYNEAVYVRQVFHTIAGNLPDESENSTSIFADLPDLPAKPIVIGGMNFGYGSVDESLVKQMQKAGIKALLAHSLSAPFFRNALNLGLPVFEIGEAASEIQPNAEIRIEFETNPVNITVNKSPVDVAEQPEFVTNLIKKAGIVHYLQSLQGNED